MQTTQVHPLTKQLHRAFNGSRDDFNRLLNEINDALFGHKPTPPSQDTPSWVAPIQRRLDQIERTLSMLSQNTAKVAADWPQVRDAITKKLQDDVAQIKALTDERDELKLKEHDGDLDADDEARLGQVDKEMNDLLNNLHGVVAQQPAPSAPAGAQATGTAAPGTDANTAQGTHDTTSAGGQASAGAAATGGPSAGAGTNDAISGGVAGDTTGAKSA